MATFPLTFKAISPILPLQQREFLSLHYSVDALEVVVALQRRYGVRIDDQNLARAIVKSVDTIAEFTQKETAKKDQ